MLRRPNAQKAGQRGLVPTALGDAQHGLFELLLLRLNLNAIECQKHQRCRGTRALVAIHEGVVEALDLTTAALWCIVVSGCSVN